MKCQKCHKPIKENTDGNKRYCQGHSIFEETIRKKEKRMIESNSLPYFEDDGTVNIFDRNTREVLTVKKENFKDITTDGGRMNGLFKFELTEE